MGLLESMTEGIVSQLERISERLDRLEEKPEYNTDIKMLTVEEVAEATSLSVPNLYGLIREGKIPCVEVGRRKLIPRRQLIKWIGDNMKNSPVGPGEFK
ncbi:helix-turn-helix domain-containing protein [Natroniella sp. ANB-PHB2]|uniref:helix-turn-helix domain-containing protein n=1 Tax=Natroniella sp. ANB-PHB2 TaxID=3384444 RepID=UPI0038D507F9